MGKPASSDLVRSSCSQVIQQSLMCSISTCMAHPWPRFWCDLLSGLLGHPQAVARLAQCRPLLMSPRTQTCSGTTMCNRGMKEQKATQMGQLQKGLPVRKSTLLSLHTPVLFPLLLVCHMTAIIKPSLRLRSCCMPEDLR